MLIDQFNILHDPSLSKAIGKEKSDRVERFIERSILPRFDSKHGSLFFFFFGSSKRLFELNHCLTYFSDIIDEIYSSEDPQMRLYEDEALETPTEEGTIPESFWDQANNFDDICGTEKAQIFINQEGRVELFDETARRVARHFSSPKSSITLDSIHLVDFIEDLCMFNTGKSVPACDDLF